MPTPQPSLLLRRRLTRYAALSTLAFVLVTATGAACPMPDPVDGMGQDPPTPTPAPAPTPAPTPAPAPPQPTVLFDQVLQADRQAAIPVAVGGCPLAQVGFVQTFNTTVSGKDVTITVVGPASNSRPQLLIADLVGNVIGLSSTFPTTQTAAITFTSSGSATLQLFVDECSGALATGTYSVRIVQAP